MFLSQFCVVMVERGLAASTIPLLSKKEGISRINYKKPVASGISKGSSPRKQKGKPSLLSSIKTHFKHLNGAFFSLFTQGHDLQRSTVSPLESNSQYGPRNDWWCQISDTHTQILTNQHWNVSFKAFYFKINRCWLILVWWGVTGNKNPSNSTEQLHPLSIRTFVRIIFPPLHPPSLSSTLPSEHTIKVSLIQSDCPSSFPYLTHISGSRRTKVPVDQVRASLWPSGDTHWSPLSCFTFVLFFDSSLA